MFMRFRHLRRIAGFFLSLAGFLSLGRRWRRDMNPMKHHDLPLNWLLGLLLVATLALANAARAQDQVEKTSVTTTKATAPASGSAAKIQKNVRKLSTIILPELEFRETTAREALASLEKMSAEFDPAKSRGEDQDRRRPGEGRGGKCSGQGSGRSPSRFQSR